MLCDICTKFDVRALLLKAESTCFQGSQGNVAAARYRDFHPGLPHFFKHHPTLASLQASAVYCTLCDAIWKAYSKTALPDELTPERLSSGIGTNQIYLGSTPWDNGLHALPHVAAFQHGDRDVTRTLAWFEVGSLRGHEPPDNRHLLARSIFHSPESEECLLLAQTWLQTCLQEHKECSRWSKAPSQLPSRIIDVGTDEGRPTLSDGNSRSKPYVALSYCWGGESDLMLTKDTEVSLRAGLPLNKFPATLRDAIIVVRKLSIRYIWIDALCIMQDSPEDWAQEASRMRDVYRGAVVTIAAASASKTSDGLFRERPECPSYAWLDWLNEGKPTPRVFLRPGSELWDSTLSNSAINTRGWTLQETLLASRTLWFGPQQISFECSRGNIDEAGRLTKAVEEYRNKEFMQRMSADRWPTALYRLLRTLRVPAIVNLHYISLSGIWHSRNLESLRQNALQFQPFFFQGLLLTPAGQNFTYYDQWREIVRRYTSRNLTKVSDVLPALSGLADNFHRITGDDYYAGVWKADIVRGLDWQRGPLRKKLPTGRVADVVPSSEYLAPSWSWASILGKSVLFAGGSQEVYKIVQSAKLVDIASTIATEDLFGALKGGHIVLRAPFLHLGTRNPRISPPSDCKLPNLLQHIYSVLLGDNTPQGHEFLQKHVEAEDQQFGLLHLCTWKNTSPIEWTEVSMLLLEGSGQGSFKRLANCRIRIKCDGVAEDESLRDEFLSAPWRKQTIRIV